MLAVLSRYRWRERRAAVLEDKAVEFTNHSHSCALGWRPPACTDSAKSCGSTPTRRQQTLAVLPAGIGSLLKLWPEIVRLGVASRLEKVTLSAASGWSGLKLGLSA